MNLPGSHQITVSLIVRNKRLKGIMGAGAMTAPSEGFGIGDMSLTADWLVTPLYS